MQSKCRYIVNDFIIKKIYWNLPPNTFGPDKMWPQVVFWAKYSSFEFKVFFLQDQLPFDRYKTQFAFLFTLHKDGEERKFNVFPKGIGTKWNENSLAPASNDVFDKFNICSI